MPVTLDEAKEYLKVEYNDEDELIQSFILSAQQLCEDVLREPLTSDPVVKIAVLYAVGYLFENRITPNFTELTTMLKYILSSRRREVFGSISR